MKIETGDQLNIDRKSIKSTVSDCSSSSQDFVSSVSVFSQKREQVFHVDRLQDKKSDEDRVVEAISHAPDLKAIVFTIDILHCKKTLSMIVNNENHYVVKVKKNQPNLLNVITQTVEKSKAVQIYIRKEKQG